MFVFINCHQTVYLLKKICGKQTDFFSSAEYTYLVYNMPKSEAMQCWCVIWWGKLSFHPSVNLRFNLLFTLDEWMKQQIMRWEVSCGFGLVVLYELEKFSRETKGKNDKVKWLIFNPSHSYHMIWSALGRCGMTAATVLKINFGSWISGLIVCVKRKKKYGGDIAEQVSLV